MGEAKPEGLKSQSEVYGLFLKLKEKPPGVLSQSGCLHRSSERPVWCNGGWTVSGAEQQTKDSGPGLGWRGGEEVGGSGFNVKAEIGDTLEGGRHRCG